MFSKFTEIGQFRGIIHNVIRTASFKGYDQNDEPILEEPPKGTLPTLTFELTTKIHGTNSGCTLDAVDNKVIALSRSRVIDVNHDNAGFAFFVEQNKEVIKGMLQELQKQHPNKKVYLYGEWCGKGIQKGVAVNQLEKRWVLFAVKIVSDNEEAYYVRLPMNISSPENNIYNIREIGVRNIDIDFNNPAEAQNKLVKIIDEVEACCPVGKYFGVEGVGEGVVASYYNSADIREHIFKCKGEKHVKSGCKVKKLKPIDEAREKLKAEFVNNHACPEWRLDQMYTEVFDVLNGGQGDIKKTGEYIKAVVQDVHKEEMDKLIEMGLEPKEVNSGISKVAKDYLFSRLNKEAGL